MADGVNGNSERIGGIHFEVSAVGAENAARQVNKAASAVSEAGKQAESTSPKFAKLRGAMSAIAAQALGVGGAMAQFGKSIFDMVPGFGKLALIIPTVAIALDELFRKAPKREAEALKKYAEDTAAAFDKLAGSIARSGEELAGPAAFKKLEELRDERIAAAKSGIEAEKAWQEWDKARKDLERFNEVESNRRNLVQSARDELELWRQRRDEQKKEREEQAKHAEMMRRFEEFVYKDKYENAKRHTEELKQQAAIVQGMIDAQTKFASQFNSKLNIEQLQSINATITRIENAINARSRF